MHACIPKHIYAYIHRWENWMQYTQSRLVPKFTEKGFDIIGDDIYVNE
jgi:hypothetical protein